jgi:pimeloyl-ACP methyl ester carboxylesterase
LEGDAGEFMLHFASKAPAFVLAREGYDVWLGNNRGCKFSVNHTTLSPEKDAAKFWDFDFEDMALKDVPAEIDYIKNVTGAEKLTYLGHSMGATQMVAGLSLIPDYYAANLNLFVAFGPATRLKNTKSVFFRKTAEMLEFFKFLVIDTLHLYNFFEPNFYDTLVKLQLVKLLPDYFAFEARGFDKDPTVIEGGRLKTWVAHTPSGAGYRNFLHYS